MTGFFGAGGMGGNVERDMPGEAKGAEPLSLGRVKVPEGQTPLNDKLGHRLLDVFNEGIKARDAGTESPYHGHSLEGCIHAAGWVQRDLRLALNSAHAAPPAAQVTATDLERIAADFEKDSNLDRYICCNGRDCGCQGATAGAYAAYKIRALAGDGK